MKGGVFESMGCKVSAYEVRGQLLQIGGGETQMSVRSAMPIAFSRLQSSMVEVAMPIAFSRLRSRDVKVDDPAAMRLQRQQYAGD